MSIFHAQEASFNAVSIAEAFADGFADIAALDAARAAALEAVRIANQRPGEMSWKSVWSYVAWGAVWSVGPMTLPTDAFSRAAALLRVPEVQPLFFEVFGRNPFGSISTSSDWLTPTVVSLATAIYDDRAFNRMPILADALTDAGCDNSDILNHCRLPGEHVRGCWAVDLVLGKN